MTEESLFKTTLIVLGLTILGPVFVASTNIAGTLDPVSEKLKSYTAAAEQTKSDAKAPSSTSKKTDDSQPTGMANNDKVKTSTSASNNKPAAKQAGTYKVRAGDTYGCIAEEHYGSYEQWPRVYEANNNYPGFSEYYLHVGAQLYMPAVAANEVLPKTDLCK